ncbi:NUDIX hydrolase [Promicromonospora citrea]|nr:NUDIX domain-containing protein [Promicromonospora citrea]NNH53166.1 NUDIX domain-containing protein [Promicromonospora citrea]
MDLRVSAYAVVTDDAGRVLLPHWSDGGRGGWTLPGGGLDPGEHPADAAVREVHEETGLHVELGALLGVDSIVVAAAERPPGAVRPAQALRIVYRARVTGGALRPEQDGSTDGVAWHTPAEVAALDRVALVDTGLRWAGLLG